MQHKLMALLAFCIISITSFAQNQLSVKVLDPNSSPLASATVSLNQKSLKTNKDGQVLFTDLKNQSYKLQISFLGYKTEIKEISPSQQSEITITLNPSSIQAEEIYVSATRAKNNSSTTYKNIGKEEIKTKNLGQDIPYLLDQTPSVVISSDAGAGVGYTSMTIRGSDAERINVTLNGIPLNNSESLGSFFINLPDFASSTQSIQIQRGIGSSTNGAAAFGGSLNFQTDALETAPYAELNNSFGSFNTWKNTLKVGSGLINNKYAFNARLSRINTDGFVERASSDLKSFYIDGGIYTAKHTLKATVFAGKEKSYQAWYGLPEPLFNGNLNRIDEYAGAMELYDEAQINRLKSGDRSYNIYEYENQTDNYTQTHAHLNYSFLANEKTKFNAGLHYTRGAGYYEEFRPSDKLAFYGIDSVILNNAIIKNADLVRQRWLDNHFYGLTYALEHKASEHINLILGGAYNQYLGDHYGEVIWSQYATNVNPRHRYYYNEAKKNDFNIFAKADFNYDNWLLNLDLQYRNIYYHSEGDDNKIKDLNFTDKLNFFNPKVGATYILNPNSNVYLSYAFANKEPSRKDYVENPLNEFPKPEKLQDIEAGYRFKNENFQIAANLYAMLYKDQLIPTGKVNDVGEAIRMNVKDSYRVGLELDGSWILSNNFIWSATAALSENKIKNFTEYLSVIDQNWETKSIEEIFYKSTTIARSPSAVLSNNFTFKPTNNISLSLLSKYVSKIYLDNTSSNERSLKPSFVNNFQATYSFAPFGLEQVDLNLLVNNILNAKYATTGYTWGTKSFESNSRVYYNFYYPQAGTNFLLGLNIRF